MKLQLERARVGYGQTTVLRDFSFSISAGEVAAVLGPNGAGKSTLLRALTAMVPLNGGRLFLDDQPLTRPTPQYLAQRGICHITERRSIFDGLTVRDNIRLFSPRREGAAGLERATSAFPVLGRRLGQLAGSLSGGEQQMLALSRAYVCAPRIVLVDEVSLGLAPVVLDEIFEFLAALARQGVGLILVEQYVERALSIAAHAYVLRRGTFVFDGSAQALTEDAAFDSYLGAQAP